MRESRTSGSARVLGEQSPMSTLPNIGGQQEAIEDFLIHGKQSGFGINVFVPEGKNRMGFDLTEETNEDGRRIDVKIMLLTDWYQVKLWQGRTER